VSGPPTPSPGPATPTRGSPRILGAVLAGGASSRFGSPKWRATLGGTPMGTRAVLALTPCVERVFALSGDPDVALLGVEVCDDLGPERGPLAGIRTAVVHADRSGADAVVVLACDLPLVSAALVACIADAWGGEDVVAPLGPRGPEPLCALWSAHALPRIEGAVRAGERSPRRLLAALRHALVPLSVAQAAAGCATPFLNVNTPGERRLAERLLVQRR